jgi:ABC-type lipoprotein release transport system permease subunit
MTHPALVHADADVAPRIFLQVLAGTAYNSLGAGLQAIDPASDPFANRLRSRLVDGRWLEPGDDEGLLIGRRMADKLKAHVGSKVVLMAGGEDGDVESRLGRVRGIFRTGLSELDGFLLVAPLEFGRRLLPGYRPGQDGAAVTRLAIFLHDPDALAGLKASLRASLPDPAAAVLDWREMMPQVVNFVLIDDLFNYIWLGFLLVMVAFGIVNTILMSALERTREFGLLRALGLKPGHLLVLVLCETVLLALVALAVGWTLGGAAHLYYASYGLDLSGLYPEGFETGGMYMNPVIYTALSAGRVVTLTAIVFATTLLSGIYPAIKAARISPMAALTT